jgi:hypothetical protein
MQRPVSNGKSISRRASRSSGQVPKRLGRGMGIGDATRRRPLGWDHIILGMILVDGACADVPVGQLEQSHVLLGDILLHVSNLKKGLAELELEDAKWVAVVFVVRTTGLEEGVQHVESKIVVILTSNLKCSSIGLKVDSHLRKILTRIL